MSQIAFSYLRSDPEKLKFYALQALELATQLNDDFGIGKSTAHLGTYHWAKSESQQALDYYRKALPYYQKLNHSWGKAQVYGNMGLVYKDLGNYPLALEQYLKARKLGEQVRDTAIIANNLNNIAVLMKVQGQYKEAIKYYAQALALYNNTRDKGAAANILNNMAIAYTELKQYDKAIYHSSEAIRTLELLGEVKGQPNAHASLGRVYTLQRRYDDALVQFRTALEKNKPFGVNNLSVSILQDMAEVYMSTGKLTEAISHYQHTAQQAEKLGLAQGKQTAYEGLTEVYRRQGKPALALTYQTKLLALKDSLFNEESTRKINQLQANYEVEKKQAEIELLRKEGEKAALVRNGIGAGLLAVLLIGGLVVSRQRLKIRNSRLLVEKSREVTEKNGELAFKNEQLSSQSVQLVAINARLSQQSAQLAEQTEKLRELDQVKSAFFANISHEFRTPLTLILGGLQEKLEEIGESVDHKAAIAGNEIKVMHRNARRLLELINQLLDLSKLDAGQLQLVPQAGDLHEFFRVLAGSFGSMAASRQIDFQLLLPQSLPGLHFDADKLEKIHSNLLSNAFKFTPNGGQVRLEVTPIEVDCTRACLRVSVANSGSVIPPGQLDKVFDRFYQGDKQYSDQQGTGIGLALVKELVQLHDGRVHAESDPAWGTRFVVAFSLAIAPGQHPVPALTNVPAATTASPVLPAAEPGGIPVKNDAPGATGSTPLLVLVEDNEDLRLYIRRHLEDRYRIVECENGRQGLEAALQRMPDLIITDWMMPEMNGLELSEKLKADERTSHIPVIMLTALATQESKLRGLETGADAYLTKPFDARELLLRVGNLVESRRKLQEKFSRQLRVSPKDIAVSSVDEKLLEKILRITEANMGDSAFGPEAFAREAGMSRMQLHRKLTALTGQATGDFIRTMRLKRAAQLLEAKAGNVSEVAYQVGFESMPHFSKCFKDQFGMTATEYQARPVAAS
ncbi:MAG: tetratricopeptide repeat protein [Cytophagales bacterium]|nr:tetratricopeptide repeat protein [Cytophagales bacterium]